jgi:hypothetical protein
MTTTVTDHDIEPYLVEGTKMASARCLTHGTTTLEQWPDMGQAARGFCCDGGLNFRFVAEFTADDLDLDPPVMRDLSGLARAVRSDAEARAYGQDFGHTSAWLWHGAGRVEPLRIALARATGFNADDYATQTWQVRGDGGRLILEVPVRIDGRT